MIAWQRVKHGYSALQRVGAWGILGLVSPALAAAITVNSLAVDNDGSCAAPDCTLPEAIAAANAAVGFDTIEFALPGSPPFVIQPTAALATITSPVLIDGATQPGFSGTPIVVIDGTSAGAGVNGLVLGGGSAGSTINGLAIVDFAAAGLVLTSNTNDVTGCYIGIATNGTTDSGNGTNGVAVVSSGNTIGGATAAARNVISGNGQHGIVIIPVPGFLEADDNKVIGNYVGTNAAGTAAVANSLRGIGVFNGQDNLIGDPMDPASGNLISGNTTNGVLVSRILNAGIATVRAAERNQIAFNRIGTDVNGTAAIPNGNGGTSTGINLQDNDNSALDNLVSGNNGAGIFIGRDSASTLTSASGNIVRRNRIGTNAAGTAALPNTSAGILMLGAANSTIGGTPAQGNLISGNGDNGIAVNAFTANLSSGNAISGNLIGTNAAGNALIANGNAGETALGIGGGSDNNTVSQNVAVGAPGGGHGIGLTTGSDGNTVTGNFVGTNSGGTLNFGNTGSGIFLNGSSENILSGNVVAFNLIGGIRIMDTDGAATGNTITGNLVYSNTGVGIDLNGDGLTPNDAGDGDGGANLRQNFPQLTAATYLGGGMLEVEGTLDSPGDLFTIEVFASPSCDASGFGEGAVFLGSIGVEAGVAPRGIGGFSSAVSFPLASGSRITATATDEDGNTSEFSACVTAQLGVLDVDLDGKIRPLTDGLLFLRKESGLTGAALVAGAVGAGCTRCDGPAVITYLNSLGNVLDIDLDADITPLNDGLLVMGYLFGFRGAVLIEPVSPDCTRCQAGDIEEHIESLLPAP